MNPEADRAVTNGPINEHPPASGPGAGHQAMPEEIALNDTLMRAIGIPFFGVVIPNVTGLFGALTVRDTVYWLGYPYFIALAFCIWQGNRYLLFRTRRRFTWFDKPVEKLILLFMNNIFFTTPLTVAWLCIWFRWALFPGINWEIVTTVALVNVICVLFVTHVYETVFMVKEQRGEQVRNAQLLQAKAEAELEALKNQIDPHFMFNTLNSLSYLISTDPPRALQFTGHLAEVYRYILSQKERTMVMVDDELSFVGHYITLLQLRFGPALEIALNIPDITGALIPPVSAFVAVENAVKHNEISTRLPLRISLSVHDSTLIIQNPLRPRRTLEVSSGIGLKNLDERFFIITGKRVKVENDGKTFTVRMPLTSLGATM